MFCFSSFMIDLFLACSILLYKPQTELSFDGACFKASLVFKHLLSLLGKYFVKLLFLLFPFALSYVSFVISLY